MERESALIEDLPDELLLAIFSRLSLQEVKLLVARVCKRWKRLSENHSIYRYLRVWPRLNREAALWLVRTMPQLEVLRLEGRSDGSEILGEGAGRHKRLRRLGLHDCRGDGVEAPALLDYMSRCPALRTFSLKGTPIKGDPEEFFAALGSAAPALARLNLNRNLQLSTTALENLVQGFSSLEDVRLNCLSFDELGSLSPYSDAPIVSLCLKMGPIIRVLKLNMQGLSDGVTSAVSSCPNLRRLFLFRALHLLDEGIVRLAALRDLQELVVTVPRGVTAEGWTSLLRCLPSLRRLTVSNSFGLDDSVLRGLGESCPGLLRLELPGCRQVTRTGLVALLVRPPVALSHLNLFSTRPCLASAFHLIPNALPCLTTFVYRSTGKNRREVSLLVSQMPRLRFTNSYRYL